MFEKMTDGDVMVYVKNTMLSLLQLSQEQQIPIDIFTGNNGCVKARAGDYVVFNYSDGHIEYSYEPISGKESTFRDWKNYIPEHTFWPAAKGGEMAAYIIIDNADHAAWLKARTYGIGGSDASAIVGMNPYKTNIELFEEKTGRRIPEDISDKPYVKYGTMAEPLIRELFRLDYPEYQVQYHENRILRSKEYPFLQASLDGELLDQEGRQGILEIKTTNILRSMQYEKWKDRIPDNYYIQVLHYLLVTGFAFVVLRAHLISSWGQDKRTTVRHYFIERSEVEEDLKMLLQEEIKFWQYVESGRKPPLLLPEL